MQHHNTPRSPAIASFRIGRHFLKQGAPFRVLGENPDYAAWPKKARELTTAFKTFAKWDVTGVCHHLPGDDTGYMTMVGKKIDFTGMPSTPPFPAVWMEAEDFGCSWAILLQQDEHRPERFVGLPIFWRHDEPVPHVSDNRFAYEWDESGLLLPTATRERDKGERPDTVAVFDWLFDRVTNVMVLAFIFSHCKNVRLEECLPTRQQRRTAQRKGEPVLKWHEIVIDPNAMRQPSTGSRRAENRPTRSLHLVRGHFATYTEERPLFGKYVGTFWIPAHVRGTTEAGTVFKDYRVKV